MAVPAKNGGSVSDKNKKQKSFRKSVLLFRCFALLIVIASATAAAATTTTATPATATSSQKDSVGIVVNDDDNDGVGGGLSQAKVCLSICCCFHLFFSSLSEDNCEGKKFYFYWQFFEYRQQKNDNVNNIFSTNFFSF